MNREPATLIILAGGESRRMGFPKHRLRTAEGPIIERLHRRLASLFVETVVVGRGYSPEEFIEGVRLVEDVPTLSGPLVGIYSGLLSAGTDLCFVLACDMPFVRKELVAELLVRAAGVDVVVPVVRGYYEPLCAVYRRTALSVMADSLGRRELKIADVYGCLCVHGVEEQEIKTFDPELFSFVNLNTKRDLKRYLDTDNELPAGTRLATR